MSEFILTGEGFQRLMTSVFNAGPAYRVKIRCRGYSMTPFIKDNDAVVFRSIDRRRGVKFGDIVAVVDRNRSKVVVHRIIRKKNGRFQTKGDNCLDADAWCSIENIIGVVDKIQNNGWIPYHCTPWQNAVIAVASKTRVLNRLIYPGFFHIKNILKK